MKLTLISRITTQFLMLFLFSSGIAGEEIWTEVKSPNFVIISNGTPQKACKTTKQFEQYRLLLKTVMPGNKVDPPVPLTVFAAKDQRSLDALLAEEKHERGEVKRSGWFLSGSEHQLVALRMDLQGNDTFHVIYHEYAHLVMNLNYGILPLWLSEGLAEFFAYSELSDNLAYLGKVQPRVIEKLRAKPLIPLPILFSVTRNSPYYHNEDKTSVFYRESWALVHYLMTGDRRAHAGQLMNYIEMIRKGVSEPDAANQAFGDLPALENALFKYIHLPTTAYFEVPAKLAIPEDQYGTRQLLLPESLGLRGELLAFYNKHERAKAMLDQALSLDPRNARANEAMGELYLRLDDRPEAGKYFIAAAEADSSSSLANFLAAQAVSMQKGDPGAAEKFARKAIELNDQFAPAYNELSRIMRQKSDLPAALLYAKKAEELQPGVFYHKMNVASMLASMERLDEAAEYGRFMIAIARNDNDRKAAESFAASVRNAQDRKLQIKRLQNEAQERARQWNREQGNFKTRNAFPGEPGNGRQTAGDPEKERMEEVAALSELPPGPSVKIAGRIKSIKCYAPSIMELALDAQGAFKLFFANDYRKISFPPGKAAAAKSLQPCRDWAGKQAEVEYQILTGKYFSGSIKSIAID